MLLPSLCSELAYTCAFHRARFDAITEARGCTDACQQRRAARRFKVECMLAYPAAYTGFIAKRVAGTADCIGCAWEQAGPHCYAWAIGLLDRLAREAGLEPATATLTASCSAN